MSENATVTVEAEAVDPEVAARRAAAEARRRRLTGAVLVGTDGETGDGHYDYKRIDSIKKADDNAKVEYERNRRKLALKGIGNVRAKPVRAMGPDGRYVTVDEREGRFQIMLRRQKNPWQLHMVRAAQLFERDYASANYSIKSPSYAPKVDNSGKPDAGAPGIVARIRLDQLKTKVGGDLFIMLELYCGLGFTLAELSEQKIGTAQSLGERLSEAVSAAAAFYEQRPPEPSRFFQRCDRFLRDASRQPARKRGGNRTPRKRDAALQP